MKGKLQKVKSEGRPNERPLKERVTVNLPEGIPEELVEVIEALPEEKRKGVLLALTVSKSESTTFRGPIPHPDIAKGWNEAAPQGADRILKMAENQLEHRSKLESHAVTEQLFQSRLGQIFAFILGLAGMGFSTYLACTGHDTVAGIFASVLIIGLVTVFVTGKRAQNKNLKEKD